MDEQQKKSSSQIIKENAKEIFTDPKNVPYNKVLLVVFVFMLFIMFLYSSTKSFFNSIYRYFDNLIRKHFYPTI